VATATEQPGGDPVSAEVDADAAAVAPLGPTLARVGIVAGIVVLIDQLTKAWALEALADGPVDTGIGSLHFTLSFNSGTAFSIGEGRGGLISLLGLLVVGFLLSGVVRWPGRLPWLAAGLVLGGALGNLLDRIFRAGDPGFLGGHVVDFIDVQFWPIFNVADIGICVGAGLLAILSFRNP
jgi:signal peptidase II